jgi:hypothetical protein
MVIIVFRWQVNQFCYSLQNFIIMKKLVLMLASLFILIVMVNGQDTLRKPYQANAQFPRRDRIHQEEHLMLIDGKLYKMQSGVRTQVESQVQLRKGGVINPDGSYQLKNAERLQLHNGECLDLDGNRYQNQRMFGKRQMMTQRQMMQNKNWNNQGSPMNQNRRPGKKS